MARALRDHVLVAIVVVGVALTAAIATLVSTNHEAGAARWLDERAELIARATEQTVDSTFADLQAVAAYLATADDMRQSDFSRFVEQMDMSWQWRSRPSRPCP